MSIEAGIMVPHPPISIPDVGQGDEKKMAKTIRGIRKAAKLVAERRPETIVILSPHSILYYDYFHISPGEEAEGDLAEFESENVRFHIKYDTEMVQELEKLAGISGLSAGSQGEKNPKLDHGTMVPLWYLQEAYKGNFGSTRFVRIGLSAQSYLDHYRLGMLIKQAALNLGRSVAVIGSGDLSHCIREDSPYGYREAGARYDKQLMEAMEKAEFGQLFDFDEEFCENAGECGHRAFLILAGCFDGVSVTAEKHSYEAPFGVGYGVCTYTPKGKSARRNFLELQQGKIARALEERREKEDAVLGLARLALEKLVVSEEKIAVPGDVPLHFLTDRAGVFVSIYKGRRLRGCVGSLEPTANSLGEEIIRASQSAGTRDTRFMPIQPGELDELIFQVDVLSELEDIQSEDELDAQKYGVVVTRGYKKGVMLPALHGVDTVEQQMAFAREKAGISPKEKVKLQRFTVERHEVR